MRLQIKQCELISIHNVSHYFGEFYYKKYTTYYGSYICMNKKQELFISHFKPKNYKLITYY